MGSNKTSSLLVVTILMLRKSLKLDVRTWLNGNTMFYETFVCFYVSETKTLCFSLCLQMFDGVERC